MLKLSDIGGLGTRTVKVRGRDAVMTVLSAVDRQLIAMAARQVPAPPVRKNPEKGSLADPEPDFADPSYLRERAAVTHEANAMIVAAALDLDIGEQEIGACRWSIARAGGDATMIKYLRAAAALLVERMTQPEIFDLADQAEAPSLLESVPGLFRGAADAASAA